VIQDVILDEVDGFEESSGVFEVVMIHNLKDFINLISSGLMSCLHE
jgi:hypothetical protein